MMELISEAAKSDLDFGKDAITFPGTSELWRFVTIVVSSGLCETKPNELIRQAIVRARIRNLMQSWKPMKN